MIVSLAQQEQLASGLDGLVLPGGESTTMGLVAERSGILPALRDAVRKMPVFVRLYNRTSLVQVRDSVCVLWKKLGCYLSRASSIAVWMLQGSIGTIRISWIIQLTALTVERRHLVHSS